MEFAPWILNDLLIMLQKRYRYCLANTQDQRPEHCMRPQDMPPRRPIMTTETWKYHDQDQRPHSVATAPELPSASLSAKFGMTIPRSFAMGFVRSVLTKLS